jgi:hypothetical protein
MKFIDDDGFSEDVSYNIDIEFWAVSFIDIPTLLTNIKIIEISEEFLPYNIDRELCKYNQKVFKLQDTDKTYYIIAGGLLVGINNWENEDRIFNYDLNLKHDKVLVTA